MRGSRRPFRDCGSTRLGEAPRSADIRRPHGLGGVRRAYGESAVVAAFRRPGVGDESRSERRTVGSRRLGEADSPLSQGGRHRTRATPGRPQATIACRGPSDDVLRLGAVQSEFRVPVFRDHQLLTDDAERVGRKSTQAAFNGTIPSRTVSMPTTPDSRSICPARTSGGHLRPSVRLVIRPGGPRSRRPKPS